MSDSPLQTVYAQLAAFIEARRLDLSLSEHRFATMDEEYANETHSRIPVYGVPSRESKP